MKIQISNYRQKKIFINKLLQIDMNSRLTTKHVVIALERWIVKRRGGEVKRFSKILNIYINESSYKC